jgi:hypothetical protein
MGKMKEVYMEIYEKFDGEIPEGYTLGDYVAEVNERKRIYEYEVLRKDLDIKPKNKK